MNKRRYTCRQSMDCNIVEAKHKRRCQYCRFQRCLESGMDLTKILARLPGESEHPLKKLLICHQSNYTARRKHAIQLIGSLSCYESMRGQPRNAQSLIRATAIDQKVMSEFLRNVGLIDSDLHDSAFEAQLCSMLLHSWLVCESIFFTRLHSGQTTNKLYYVDESFIRLNEDYLRDYYQSNASILDPEFVARSAYPLLEEIINSARTLEQAQVDQHEMAALLVLLLLRNLVQRLGPSKRTLEWQNQTLRGLGLHCRNMYKDVAERFGQLMLCLESMECADKCCDELALVVQLSYKSTGLDGYKLYVRGQTNN